MSTIAPSVPEIFNACEELFGRHVRVSVDFVKYLEPSGVKAAYRERVFESHPDRARTIGVDEDTLAQSFKKVHDAYELLSYVIREENKLIFLNGGPGVCSRPDPQTGSPAADRDDHYYNGPLPNRYLRIGQFLYYSGAISWQSLIEALVWQRRTRPLIGAIARSWNLLSHDDITAILRNKKPGERFGDYALKKGLLTRGNIVTLLGKQRLLNRPLGDFFILSDLLGSRDMERWARAQHRHNTPFNGFR